MEPNQPASPERSHDPVPFDPAELAEFERIMGLEPNQPASPEHSLKPVPFPTDPAEFLNDDRIAWSRLDNNWILETGYETFIWNDTLKTWDVLDVDEPEVLHPREVRKRKRAEFKAAAAAQKKKKKKTRENTAVWVSNLPLDTKKEEIQELFARCGIFMEELDSEEAKIKMYYDDHGNFKGEALVVYFRPESVNCAISMFDGLDLRLGVPPPSGPMRVEAAWNKYLNSEPVGRPKLTKEQKHKYAERYNRLHKRYMEAFEEDEEKLLPPRKPTRKEHIVVLKHMFTLQALEAKPAEILDIRNEIWNECSKIGEVTNVKVYDKEPEGVVTVRFKEVEDARRCVAEMNGRSFDKMVVEASIQQGRIKYQKSDGWIEHSDNNEWSQSEEDRLDQLTDNELSND